MLSFRRYTSKYSCTQIIKKYPVGGIFHGYEIKRLIKVPELKLVAVDLVHNQTGSQHLHIDRDDKNNVFSIGFNTNPPDSTGVPHILEHTTLCGSQKYPVRDPFFKMLNRSLANFMNAMTGHDYTFYPFATTNQVDFANLRDVYLDSTLNPLLNEHDFLQEGWRLEYSDVNDPNSDITFKGVVYNEMKGQTSNANYYFWIKFQESIYPSLNNSGGDPSKMTNLKYSDLVDFHSRNYHPSNSKTFTYGNFPLVDTLKKLNECFSGFGKRSILNSSLYPLKLTDNVDIMEDGELDPMLPSDKQLKTSLTWICGHPKDVYETFLLKLLGNLLLDGHSSIFYQKLIEEGLAYEFSVNTGVESQTSSNFFTIGVQGCNDVVSVHEKIMTIFDSLLLKTFEPEKIDAIIHQLELSKKDQRTDFGLQLLYSILPGWVNKVDPFEVLCLNQLLERFKNDWELKGDIIFKDLIKKYIINKPVFKFTMKGTETFSKSLQIEEKQRLESKIESLNTNDKDIIYKRGLKLQEMQNKKEDLSSLPSLKISDIPRIGDKYSLVVMDNIINRVTDTNGLTYLRAKRLLDTDIPPELYPYLSLFTDSLTSLGTSSEDYSKIEEKMKLNTGGISISISVNSDIVTSRPMLQLEFDGWSLNNRTSHIFDIWKKLLCDTDFIKHKDKLKVLIKSLASSNTSSIAENGHSFARNFAAAHLSKTKAITDNLYGVEYLRLVTKLSSILDNDSLFQTEVIEKLIRLKECIIASDNMKFMVISDSSAQVNSVNFQISQFLKQLPQISFKENFDINSYPILINKSMNPKLIQFPFQVHYTGQSMMGVPYTHTDSASLQVLSNILTFKHLHREIREKGGAYGGGSTYNALDGIFNFYSYRDPHPMNSLTTFENTASYVLNNLELTQQDLNEAKLTIFQNVDSPISAKSEGTAVFTYGITDEIRQKRREQLLDVETSDIYRVTEKYLVKNKRISAIVGPPIPNTELEIIQV